MPINQTEPPVKGDHFYDRQTLIPQLWERLDEGANILLLAPRRVGKSSVMFRLLDQAKSNGFQPLMISVAGARSETEFIRELIQALDALHSPEAKKMLTALVRRTTWLRRVRKLTLLGSGLEIDELGDDWKNAAEDLRIGLCQLQDRWLILIDELPVFVHRLIRKDDSADRAEVFLAWFRDLRQAENAPRKVQWFSAGSIGLDSVTRQASLGDTINDLHKEARLGAFSLEVADSFLTELGEKYELAFNIDVKAHFLSMFTWLIPFHIQLLFSEIRDLVPKGTPPTLQDVDAAYEQLLSPSKRSVFDFWVQRLSKELPAPSNTQSLLLLDTIVLDDDGVTRQTLNQVLSAKVTDPDERQTQLDFLLQVLQTSPSVASVEESHSG